MAGAISQLRGHAAKVYELLVSTEAKRRRYVVAEFASKYGLVYFRSVSNGKYSTLVIRGATSSLHHRDEHICVGTHDGYDMVYTQRRTSLRSRQSGSPRHRYHLMEFDFKTVRDAPLMMIVSRQLPAHFSEAVLLQHRQLRLIDPALLHGSPDRFSQYYSVLASPSLLAPVYKIIGSDVSATMTAHHEPFSVEIQGDNLILFTDNPRTSVRQLTKMLHYGIWLAKHIDTRIE